MMIKDSGNRTEFSTGAVRDMHEGKGRFDLLPWNAIHEVAKHCEEGAIKYGEHNIDKGIPQHSLIDSAIRHLSKYIRNEEDEDHLRAACWNLLWALEQRTTHPELNDLYCHRPVFEREPIEDDEEDTYAGVGKRAAEFAQALNDIIGDDECEEEECEDDHSDTYNFLIHDGDYKFVSMGDSDPVIARKYIHEVLASLNELTLNEAETICDFFEEQTVCGSEVTFLEFMNYFCEGFMDKCLDRKEPEERWWYGVANVSPYQLARYYWVKEDVSRMCRMDVKGDTVGHLYIPLPTYRTTTYRAKGNS